MATPTSSSGYPAGDLRGRLLAKRYRLNSPIASGGMAQVWEATDEVLARRVAVKLLHGHLADDDSFVKRFRAEAIAAARLAHPSIVSVYDTFSDDGLEAIVMELVVGTTMRADLDQHGPLRLEAVLAIGTQVADALGAAHASGLVHRDVKPANILLSADGRVLVADFGIAKAAEGADLTSDGSMVGTAKYLAPEQVEGGRIDGRADLYALGIVLYEALTGTAPFVADTDAGTAFARLHRDAEPPRRLRPEIPLRVEAVVMQAMNRRPDDRFSSAAAMRAALLGAGADPARAPAAAVAAVANDTGERPAVAPIELSPPPPPVRPPAADPTSAPGSGPAAARAGADQRPWWPAALVVLLAVGLVAAVVVATRDSGSGGGTTPVGPVTALTLAGVRSFDPFDPDQEFLENEDALPLAIDGDPETAWTTQNYSDPELPKGGVGLVVELDGTHQVTEVAVSSVAAGWAADLYVVSGDVPADLAGWGQPVGSIERAEAGTTTVTVDGVDADQVMVWITRTTGAGSVDITEVEVRGR